MAEYNHAETRRCWDCYEIYVPIDEVGNYTWCPECRRKRFAAKKQNIITDELIEKVAKKYSKDENESKKFRLWLRK